MMQRKKYFISACCTVLYSHTSTYFILKSFHLQVHAFFQYLYIHIHREEQGVGQREKWPYTQLWLLQNLTCTILSETYLLHKQDCMCI